MHRGFLRNVAGNPVSHAESDLLAAHALTCSAARIADSSLRMPIVEVQLNASPRRNLQVRAAQRTQMSLVLRAAPARQSCSGRREGTQDGSLLPAGCQWDPSRSPQMPNAAGGWSPAGSDHEDGANRLLPQLPRH